MSVNDLIPLSEVARLLDVSHVTAWKRARAGKLGPVHLNPKNGRIYISLRELEMRLGVHVNARRVS